MSSGLSTWGNAAPRLLAGVAISPRMRRRFFILTGMWTTHGGDSKLMDARAFDRHRGGGHSSTPATPPCVRVRTRRFEPVTLTFLEQGRKSERFEVRIRKPHRESLGLREVPRAATAAGGVARQPLSHPQFQ